MPAPVKILLSSLSGADLILATDRLRLRPLGEGDGALYAALYGDAEVMRHVRAPLAPAEAARSFAIALRQQQDPAAARRWWVLQLRDDAGPCGLIGLQVQGEDAELGILLQPARQGRGLAREAVRRLCEFASGPLRAATLAARHSPANAAAARLFEAAGFQALPTPVCGERHWRFARPGREPCTDPGRTSGPATNPLP